MEEYWDLIENPTGVTYQHLIKVLCDNSDKFYFITRKQLTYNQETLTKFSPYVIDRYETKKWANTMTKGSPATVFVLEANDDTCNLLQQNAKALYDWISPELPEDLTFIKNNFEWFSSTTHEEYAYFKIRSDFYRKLVQTIIGLKLKKID